MTNVITENIAILDKVLPVVVRVHGKEHPELSDVLSSYQELKAALENEADAAEIIASLRKLTGNYTLPEDACEAYAKVYRALSVIA